MSVKEEVYKTLTENAGKERKNLLEIVMAKHKLKIKSAEAYYTAWKKDYMKPNFNAEDITEIKQEKVVNEELKEVVEKKADDADEAKEEFKAEELKGFKPVILKGEFGLYDFSNDGVSVDSSTVTFISQESIQEQLKAVELWEKHYKGVNKSI